jgi:hypothetical protein
MVIPPSWIEEFVQQVSYCLFPQEVPAPLGCHYHYEIGCWEIALFPSQQRRRGGVRQERPSPFSFDIRQVLPLFEELEHLDWVAMPISEENEVGPHLLIEGVVGNHPVLLRICSEIPLRFAQEQELSVYEK